MSGPIVPSWIWDTFVLCVICSPVVVVIVWAIVDQVKTAKRRRAARLARIDQLMSRGMRAAWRNGWIKP